MKEENYTLCGSDQLLSWEQSGLDKLDIYQSTNFKNLITQSPWPLRYSYQIPEKWLNKDPNFYILLRAKSNLDLPKWCISPENYRFIPRQNKKELKKILFINRINKKNYQWQDLLMKYPNSECLWTNDTISLFKNWPIQNYISPNDFIFQIDWVPDLIVDIDYWVEETIGPIHLHALHLGSMLLTDEFDGKRKIIDERQTWYGNWEILEPL